MKIIQICDEAEFFQNSGQYSTIVYIVFLSVRHPQLINASPHEKLTQLILVISFGKLKHRFHPLQDNWLQPGKAVDFLQT